MWIKALTLAHSVIWLVYSPQASRDTLIKHDIQSA